MTVWSCSLVLAWCAWVNDAQKAVRFRRFLDQSVCLAILRHRVEKAEYTRSCTDMAIEARPALIALRGLLRLKYRLYQRRFVRRLEDWCTAVHPLVTQRMCLRTFQRHRLRQRAEKARVKAARALWSRSWLQLSINKLAVKVKRRRLAQARQANMTIIVRRLAFKKLLRRWRATKAARAKEALALTHWAQKARRLTLLDWAGRVDVWRMERQALEQSWKSRVRRAMRVLWRRTKEARRRKARGQVAVSGWQHRARVRLLRAFLHFVDAKKVEGIQTQRRRERVETHRLRAVLQRAKDFVVRARAFRQGMRLASSWERRRRSRDALGTWAGGLTTGRVRYKSRAALVRSGDTVARRKGLRALARAAARGGHARAVASEAQRVRRRLIWARWRRRLREAREDWESQADGVALASTAHQRRVKARAMERLFQVALVRRGRTAKSRRAQRGYTAWWFDKALRRWASLRARRRRELKGRALALRGFRQVRGRRALLGWVAGHEARKYYLANVSRAWKWLAQGILFKCFLAMKRYVEMKKEKRETIARTEAWRAAVVRVFKKLSLNETLYTTDEMDDLRKGIIRACKKFAGPLGDLHDP